MYLHEENLKDIEQRCWKEREGGGLYGGAMKPTWVHQPGTAMIGSPPCGGSQIATDDRKGYAKEELTSLGKAAHKVYLFRYGTM